MTSKSSPSFRHQTFTFLELGSFGGRAAAYFEYFMIFMILANVVAVTMETVPELWEAHAYWFHLFDKVSIFIFTVEYGLRVWSSAERENKAGRTDFQRRLAYIFSPYALIDLVAILPFYFGAFFQLDLRALRIFRLLRLLKLARYSPAISSLARVIYAERRALLAALIIMLGIEVFAATLMYKLEHAVQPEEFGTIPDALWWAMATLTTVGYGDVVPVTAAGKIVAGLIMVLGLAFYALPIGIIASGFTDEVHRRDFMVPIGLVEAFPAFKDVKPETIREISSRVRSLSLMPGTVLTHPNDIYNGIYLIISGEMHAYLDHRPLPLLAGDFIGEPGILSEEGDQVATVVNRPSKLMWLESSDLHLLLMTSQELAPALQKYTLMRLRAFVEDGLIEEKDYLLMEEKTIAWYKKYSALHYAHV